jgi:uncharacterized membrane protein
MPEVTQPPQNSEVVPKTSVSPIIHEVETQELYSGPIPHPEFLKRFGDIDPSFPERIMKMTEDNNNADVIMKNRMSLVSLVVPVIGQIASFLISCIGFGTAILFAMKGIEIGAITAAIGGVAPIIMAALVNIQKNKK